MGQRLWGLSLRGPSEKAVLEKRIEVLKPNPDIENHFLKKTIITEPDRLPP
jgi:hypothetical protein